MALIYVLENQITEKCYIGQTKNKFSVRLSAHKNGNTSYISRAIKKYGWENFKTYEYYVPENSLDYFEVGMIKKANCICKVCKGKRKTSGGYHWKYAKESN